MEVRRITSKRFGITIVFQKVITGTSRHGYYHRVWTGPGKDGIRETHRTEFIRDDGKFEAEHLLADNASYGHDWEVTT